MRPEKQSRRWVWWGVGVSAAVAAVAGLTEVQLATPFRGPGYTRHQGVTLPGVGPTVVVALTHATLDRGLRGPFDDHTRRVIRSLPEQPDHIGYSVRTRLFGHEVWTMTVWKDHAAVEAFFASKVHQTAIREGMAAVRTAQFLRFEWPTDQVPPPWSEAMRRLESVEVVDYNELRGQRSRAAQRP